MDQKQVYKRRVWEFLERIEPGQMYVVDSQCKPENRALFVQSVKDYMDAMPWQGWLSFNADYTKFYKIHPIKFKDERETNPPFIPLPIAIGTKGDEQPPPQ